jgi:hypothetical protein
MAVFIRMTYLVQVFGNDLSYIHEEDQIEFSECFLPFISEFYIVLSPIWKPKSNEDLQNYSSSCCFI